MNTSLRILLLGFLLISQPCFGQGSEVPARISYQGIITDAAGNPVGQGTPTNRKVIFRIWNSPTSFNEANLVYSEEQIATVAEGEFSVLIGAGAVVTDPLDGIDETVKGPGTVSVNEAFAGADRYLGVSIADGAGSIGNEISPRQQIVSTAFSFRAREAETIINSAVGTDALSDGSVTLAKMASSSVDSVSLLDGSVGTIDLAGGAVTAAKLASDIGVWSVSGANVYRSGGSVGVGTGSPVAPLHVFRGGGGTGNNSTASLVLEDDTNHYLQFKAPSSNETGVVFGNPNSSSDGGIYYSNNARSISLRTGGNNTRMFLASNGNVGIGTGSPQGRLSITGSNSLLDPTLTGVHIGTIAGFPSDSAVILRGGPGGGGQLRFSNPGTSGSARIWMVNDSKEIRIDGSDKVTLMGGNVGIGTTNPTRGKLEVVGLQQFNIGTHAALYFDGERTGRSGGNVGTSIYADKDIVGFVFRAWSDERIKHIEGVSDSAVDLDVLRQIEISDYTYIDQVNQTSAPQKKVIAQQVEKVFPQAVSKGTEVVPDLYAKASLEDGWIQLETPLVVGDRVRLISKEADEIYEVLEVAEGSFRTKLTGNDDQIFVYGREVDDFRTVDYEAISMLNVSATQELHRRLVASEEKVESLKQRVAELEARDVVRDERLSAIEAMLNPGGSEDLKTVSTSAK